MIQVQEVPLQYVNVLWTQVEPFLVAGLKYADGDLTIDEIKIYALQGVWSLLVAVDEDNQIHGATTVNFFNRINDRVAFVTAIGGRGLFTPDIVSQFSDILRSHGATCIEGTVRDSLVRLLARISARKKSNTVKITL
jgi:hypothetical protein